MSPVNEQEIKDKMTKVCICKGISRHTIKKVIAEGAESVQRVSYLTGAATGPCQGRRCASKIQELIDESKKV